MARRIDSTWRAPGARSKAFSLKTFRDGSPFFFHVVHRIVGHEMLCLVSRRDDLGADRHMPIQATAGLGADREPIHPHRRPFRWRRSGQAHGYRPS